MAAIATIGASTTAGAAPTKNTETYTCNGRSTTFAVAGRSGVLDGQHDLGHNPVITGTFDPDGAGPLPAEPFHDEQWTSGQTGGLLCTTTFTETTPEGGVSSGTIRLSAISTGN